MATGTRSEPIVGPIRGNSVRIGYHADETVYRSLEQEAAIDALVFLELRTPVRGIVASYRSTS